MPAKLQEVSHAFRRNVVLNYITLHYIYYISVCLLASIVFWASSTPAKSVPFIDCLFLVTSAMTEAGLNTVNLSELNTWQQFMLFFLMLIGSSVLVSSAVVHTRKKVFEARFARIIQESRQRRRHTGIDSSGSHPRRLSSRKRDSEALGESSADRAEPLHSRELEELPGTRQDGYAPSSEDHNHDNAAIQSENGDRSLSIASGEQYHATFSQDASDAIAENVKQHVKFRPSPQRNVASPRASERASEVFARQDIHRRYGTPRTSFWEENHPIEEAIEERRSTSLYFESRGFIGRNSQFHSLSLAERERLGGVEYKAIKLLEKIVLCYYILWQLLGCLGLGAWIAYNQSTTTLDNGLNPWWVGAFLGVSAFNNNGMSLLDANMVPFQSSHYVLLTMALMILAGNTCYPVFLRLLVWLMRSLLPQSKYFEDLRQTLKFLLDHPRRCYTHLFPSHHTFWLLGSLVLLNGIDWGAFEVLNIDNHAIYRSPDALPVLDGFFQAVAVRSGGFYVVPIAQLSIGLLVLYVLMMYISVYPVTITLRNSNVYEERSLGIYSDDPETEPTQKQSWASTMLSKLRDPNKEGARAYFVRQQLRGQLAHDLWWLCLAVLAITIIETRQFDADPVTFAVFNIVFETVSAYGCVGISTGAPNVNFSFCGVWHSLSKVVLCAVMLRGRHRGLPVTIDQAVLLPGDHLGAAEEEDAAVHREMAHERRLSRSRGTHATTLSDAFEPA